MGEFLIAFPQELAHNAEIPLRYRHIDKQSSGTVKTGWLMERHQQLPHPYFSRFGGIFFAIANNSNQIRNTIVCN